MCNGEFRNKSASFPPEYTAFINRLTTQIQIDMEFTDMVSELTKAHQMPAIKQIILAEMANPGRGTLCGHITAATATDLTLVPMAGALAALVASDAELSTIGRAKKHGRGRLPLHQAAVRLSGLGDD